MGMIIALPTMLGVRFNHSVPSRGAILERVSHIAHLVAPALVLLASSSLARADDFAYTSLLGSHFGTIDLNTGTFTPIGNGYTSLSNNPVELAGLGVLNGGLYGISDNDAASNTVYMINSSNGDLSVVGSSGSADIQSVSFGSTTGGLYALARGNTSIGQANNEFYLYSINLSTGSATLAGDTGVAVGGGYYGLSTNSNVLYFSSGNTLYTLSTTTGLANSLGQMGADPSYPAGTMTVGAMVFENGMLYGGEDLPYQKVDVLNTGTGGATFGPAYNTTSGITGYFSGLAPVPEPETYAMMLAGLGLVAFIAKRRKQQTA
jgi:PEP-CTERM motif